ncbi:hypothetical protein C8F01DRAFT_1331735 [Mycena amicta]|nr:hypothetical protein C8F01DRAFT_1331735 [Mycena amicta]
MNPQGTAIVGIAAQLPSGKEYMEDLDYNTLWEFLLKGKQAYEPLVDFISISAPEFRSSPTIPTQGSFLKEPSSFDNIAFGVSSRDARVAPYSTRRLIDLSFRALQDSGIDSRGQSIGCFMSGNRAMATQRPIDGDGGFAWLPYFLSNRISYMLNLTGPSVTLDTACSSSLTAVHLAIGAIERGDCTAALVGAAQINREYGLFVYMYSSPLSFLSPMEWAVYAQGGLLAPDGKCKPLDQSADGFGRAEGAVVLVLKPLVSAIRDCDHVYGVIVASAVNSTGSRLPLNVPNAATQRECALEAYRRADLQPTVADYVELHATGTAVGDPIEIEAVGEIFRSNSSVPLGALKGNFGHFEVAAFLAAVLKACLIFQFNCIPPTVNLSHPCVACGDLNVTIPVQPTPLACRSHSGNSTISILASGMGGATGHAILQSPTTLTQSYPCSTAPNTLFLIGGLSSQAVAQISQVAAHLPAENVQKYAVLLARRARQLPWRTWFTTSINTPSSVPSPAVRVADVPPPVIFVFSGQGPQHMEMGRELFASYPVFRETVLALDNIYRRRVGTSLIEEIGLFTGTPPTRTVGSTWPAIVTLPAICALQIALVDVFTSIGIIPELMFGHSAGETAALYASGAGPKEMAMEIAIARGEAMGLAEGEHLGMAMLACDAHRAGELIQRILSSAGELGGLLELTCFNSEASIAVSGTATHLNLLVTLAMAEGIFAQRLRTMVPGHSSIMDSIRYIYQQKMDDIWARYPGRHTPRIPVLSTCRDAALVNEFTPEYLWDNARNPVNFSAATTHSLANKPNAVYLEMSCHPVLSSSIVAHGIPETHSLCPMLRNTTKNHGSESRLLLAFVGQLSLLGINTIDLSRIYGGPAKPLDYPSLEHPLKTRHIPPPKFLVSHDMGFLSGPLSSGNLKVNQSSHPDLAQHRINGEPILPAAAFIEIVLAIGASQLWDVNFKAIVSLSRAETTDISLQYLDERWAIISNQCSTSRREHASGCLSLLPLLDTAPRVVKDIKQLWTALPPLEIKEFYHSLLPTFGYGPLFRRVIRCHGGPSAAIGEVKGLSLAESNIMFLPVHIEHFTFYRKHCGSSNWISHITLQDWTPDNRTYNILVTDTDGLVICELRGLTVRANILPPVVSRHFEPSLQTVDLAIEVPKPYTHSAIPQDTDNLGSLYKVLDQAAWNMLQGSLEATNLLAIGPHISRQRYLLFAQRAIQHGMEHIHPIPEEQLNALQQRWPHHFEITQRIAAVHQSVFTSPTRVVESLYSDDLMSQFYSPEYHPTCVIEQVAATLSLLLSRMQYSGRKFVRILEVGAGTGSLTHELIKVLGGHRDILVQYTVSDVSYSLANGLAHTLDHEFVIGKAYDIAEDPKVQGIPLHHYDIIVSLFVLHVAPDLHICLRNLQSLLLPGGLLLTAELDGSAWAEKRRGTLWHDCIFGAFQEWFGFQDGRDHPTLNPSAWKAILAETGYQQVQMSMDKGPTALELVFVAQRPLSIPLKMASPLLAISQYHFHKGKEFELQSWLRKLDKNKAECVYIVGSAGADVELADESQVSAATQWISDHQELFDTGEDVVYVDADSTAKVPRVVLSQPLLDAAPYTFRGDGAYVLLGGAGGLGVDLAVWMYQHGARHLFLTSRRGMNSFNPLDDALELAKIAFLQRQPDVELSIEACDGTDSVQMEHFINSFTVELAGAFLLTLTLDDAPFLEQTQSSFQSVLDSKLRVFQIFSDLVQMDKLDFFVAFSSLSGLIGLPGQSNYASACTALNGQLTKYENAFSLITPGIGDAGYLTREGSQHVAHRRVLASLTARELWACLEDGLNKLKHQPFDQYIPDLDWNALDNEFHLPRTMVHLRKLLQSIDPQEAVADRAIRGSLLQNVLTLLEVPHMDFDIHQPLTAYGLDSLGAAKLSTLLRPFSMLSQMKLLSGMSWAEVEAQLALGIPSSPETKFNTNTATSILCHALGITLEDFSGDLALSSFGLDSLSATHIATALQPYLNLTQLQLLGQATWNELLDGAIAQSVRATSTDTAQSISLSSSVHLLSICRGNPSTAPLICIPGANGRAAPFFEVAASGVRDCWALEVVATTPTSSLAELATFWKQEIYKWQPHGPYRIAAYSAGTVLSVLLVKMLQLDGNEVEKLIFIDYSPGLWATLGGEALLQEQDMDHLLRFADLSIVDMLRNDPSISADAIKNYQDAIDGLDHSPAGARDEVRIVRQVMRLIFEFLDQFKTGESPSELTQSYRAWLQTVNVPIVVVVAERGMAHSFPGGNIPDLGASEFDEALMVTVKVIAGVGHFGIFANASLGAILEI